MKNSIRITQAFLAMLLFSSFSFPNEKTCSLTVEVNGLRNSKGIVQFTLYDKDIPIPDKKFGNSYAILKGEITGFASTVTFENLPTGRYAVHVLHDENNNGKIDKGLVLPIEGIGLSNYQSISPFNRPKFDKASIDVQNDLKVNIKINYL